MNFDGTTFTGISDWLNREKYFSHLTSLDCSWHFGGFSRPTGNEMIAAVFTRAWRVGVFSVSISGVKEVSAACAP